MDATDLIAIEKRMEDARIYLRDNAGGYGNAKQVREYDSDRRKQLLAKCAKPFIANGDSNAVAETKARSGDAYAIELDKLADSYAAAETTIALYDAASVSFDAARSLLSMAKSQMQLQ